MTQRVLNDINRERDLQRREWGGDAHDDLHDAPEWVAILADHLGRAGRVALVRGIFEQTEDATPRGVFRYQLVRVAAVAVAAIEALDRAAAVPLCTSCAQPLVAGGVKDGDEHLCLSCAGEAPVEDNDRTLGLEPRP